MLNIMLPDDAYFCDVISNFHRNEGHTLHNIHGCDYTLSFHVYVFSPIPSHAVAQPTTKNNIDVYGIVQQHMELLKYAYN